MADKYWLPLSPLRGRDDRLSRVDINGKLGMQQRAARAHTWLSPCGCTAHTYTCTYTARKDQIHNCQENIPTADFSPSLLAQEECKTTRQVKHKTSQTRFLTTLDRPKAPVFYTFQSSHK